MIAFDYLEQGVRGLANAHRAGTMAGHLGAAVAAGYFFGEDQSDLPPEVDRGLEAELDRIIAGEEAIWFDAKKAGVTPEELFQPLPQQAPETDAIPPLLAALQQNVGQTRQSGHNIIFASIAIRALQDHPEFATPAITDGIRRLISGFDNAHAGRGYYGQPQGWQTGNQVKLALDPDFPPYVSIPQMVDVTIGELIGTARLRKQGFGGLWHLINHAAAIVELNRLGHEVVAHQALPAHHQHVRLWRSLPDVEAELGPVVKADHDPREPVYWQGMLKRDEARLTHRVKTLYGYFTLRQFVDDGTRLTQADESFLFLMA